MGASPLVVAVAWDLGPGFAAAVKAVAENIEVRDIAPAVRGELALLRRGRIDSPEGRQLASIVERALRDAEVTVTGYLPYRFFERSPKMVWVHCVGAGVDFMLPSNAEEMPIVFTDSSGAKALRVAESALALMLALAKRHREFARAQALHRWAARGEAAGKIISLQGLTVAILGVGAIGGEVARLCKSFQMTVLGTRRRCASREFSFGHVDELVPLADVAEIVGRADFVVLTMPLTRETKGMFDLQLIRHMKKTAYLVNVSRGGIVDEEQLIRQLKMGAFAGAALDVFGEEPLPPENELWRLPNVIVTPHAAGGVMTEGIAEDAVSDIFCENLRRYLRGEQLLNIVDKQLRY